MLPCMGTLRTLLLPRRRPRSRPRLFFDDEDDYDDEDDSPLSYFPLNSALRFSRKAFMPSF